MAAWASFRFIGLERLQSNMAKRGRRLGNMTVANKRAIVAIDRFVQKNFESEGAGIGSPWQPLAPATVKRRRKGSSKILQDTGQLKTRWKHLATKKTAALQSGVEYGIFHDKGGKHLPKRKIIPTQKIAKPIVKKVYAHFIKEGLSID